MKKTQISIKNNKIVIIIVILIILISIALGIYFGVISSNHKVGTKTSSTTNITTSSYTTQFTTTTLPTTTQPTQGQIIIYESSELDIEGYNPVKHKIIWYTKNIFPSSQFDYLLPNSIVVSKVNALNKLYIQYNSFLNKIELFQDGQKIEGFEGKILGHITPARNPCTFIQLNFNNIPNTAKAILNTNLTTEYYLKYWTDNRFINLISCNLEKDEFYGTTNYGDTGFYLDNKN